MAPGSMASQRSPPPAEKVACQAVKSLCPNRSLRQDLLQHLDLQRGGAHSLAIEGINAANGIPQTTKPSGTWSAVRNDAADWWETGRQLMSATRSAS